MFNGKQLAGAAKAALHLVGNHDDAMRIANFTNALQKARRRGNKPGFALHRLNHNSGHRAGVKAAAQSGEPAVQARMWAAGGQGSIEAAMASYVESSFLNP